MREEFCPRCFADLPAGASVCPACGVDLEAWGRLPYLQRLVHALRHPLSEVRMRAIITLGWLRAEDAAPALVECALRDGRDVVEGLEVVESLSRLDMGPVRRAALDRLAREHPARAVRAAAERAGRKQGA
jgi:HEAT repeat protein